MLKANHNVSLAFTFSTYTVEQLMTGHFSGINDVLGTEMLCHLFL